MKADLKHLSASFFRAFHTGRASRLQVPVLAKLWWKVAGFVGVCLLIPVALFFVFLALLRKAA